MTGSRRGRAAARWLLGAVGAVALALPATASGASVPPPPTTRVISSSGPLNNIYLSSNLSCQVDRVGDAGHEFVGGTSGASPSACGTFVAVTGNSATVVYGPPVPGVAAMAAYTPVSQSAVTGSGTAASPYQVVTVVSVPNSLTITQTDRYVVGNDFYTTDITVSSSTGQTFSQAISLYHAGDCYMQGGAGDSGFGASDAGTGRVSCTPNPANIPTAHVESFLPTTAGSSYYESTPANVWGRVLGASAFPNTCDCGILENNAAGVSWSFTVPSGSAPPSFTRSLTTFTGRPTSSASIPSCSNTGSIAVTVQEPGGPGPGTVHYRVDRGTEKVVKTNAAGVGLVSVREGRHTLEYWGADITGSQESSHHTASVFVDTKGPVVKITSDQHKSLYVTGERGSVSVTATDQLSALATNPSRRRIRIYTRRPSGYSVQRTATDKCGNSTTARFGYLVLPRPRFGKSATIGLVSGKVLIKLPRSSARGSARASVSKGQPFVPLVGIRSIPVGSVLDTNRGVVRVFTAAKRTGTSLQQADFANGVFQVLQSRRLRGLTDVVMRGGDFRACAAGKLGKARSTRLSSRVIRRLRGTAHGRFRTRGRFSAATVRGTIWETIDRCDGTLTRVKRGVVIVRDLRKHRNITLRAGKSHFVRAPG